jgi:hypothetical protein
MASKVSKFYDGASELERELEELAKERENEEEDGEKEGREVLSAEAVEGGAARRQGIMVFERLGLSEEEIEDAKSTFKRVYSFVYDEDTAFLYKSIKKREYDNIVNLAKGDEEDFKFKIIRTAVIWPRIEREFLQESPAGLQELLFKLIMTYSGFVNLEAALSNVVEL